MMDSIVPNSIPAADDLIKTVVEERIDDQGRRVRVWVYNNEMRLLIAYTRCQILDLLTTFF